MLLENAGNISGVVGENLRNSHDLLPMNIELVTLKSDLELQPDLNSLLESSKDEGELQKTFKELEFNAWISEKNNESPQPKNTSYVTVDTNDKLAKLLKLINSCKAFALGYGNNLVGYSYSWTSWLIFFL